MNLEKNIAKKIDQSVVKIAEELVLLEAPIITSRMLWAFKRLLDARMYSTALSYLNEDLKYAPSMSSHPIKQYIAGLNLLLKLLAD